MGEDVHIAARVAAAATAARSSSQPRRPRSSSDRSPTWASTGSRTWSSRWRSSSSARELPAAQDDLEHEPASAGELLRRPRAGARGAPARIEDGARLVTLTGPGGSGKTRVAIEAAASLVPSFAAGVFWIGLAPLRDRALVTETIARALGARNGLAEHIGERELLLLVDNFEQVIDAAPEVAALLAACPNLSLLVTSRELLRVQGEVEYPVPPLAETEAVALFCARSSLEPSDEVAELCRRLDNLPLAVELAAARTKALAPARILDRLAQRLDLLKGGRDADPRQQTLRATIEWSYDLLSEDERQLFRRLSVFAGGCTLEAAEQVCDADLDTLQSLVEKSLVRFSASATGCSRRSASTRASGSSRRRRKRFDAGIAPGSSPSPRRAPGLHSGDESAVSARLAPTTRTCAPPSYALDAGRAGRRRSHPRRDLSVPHLARESGRGTRVGRAGARRARPALRARAGRGARRRR